jgi:hypothetical protein
MTTYSAIGTAAFGLANHAPKHSNTSGLGDFDWPALATLIAGLIAGAGVLVGLLAGSARARLDTRRGVYAEAVRAVSDYLEGPYRVARCHNDPDQRFALSKDLSEIQGRIDSHLVLVELHGPDYVFEAYSAYVAVARREAGQQMAAEWRKRPPRRHADMNMERRFPRSESNRAKKDVLAKMAKDVKPGWRPHKRFV